MARAECTVNINASFEKVFSFIANAENNLKWRDAVVSIALESGVAGQQGAVYKQILRGPAGRAVDGSYRISRVEPNQLLEFDVIAGPARPHGKFFITPEGSGARLTFVLDLKAKGFLMHMIEGTIQKMMDKEVANLEKVKTILETPA